ncbi:hypothetical protein HNQ99_003095 [Rhizorhapis suberifaciens]|uniref:Uncharacterized protein n=1 Tax=Rhizorhapis suberifaciens TaxID=13656 RepID=A0A840HYW2_9SPHN|nr:hypothetical protein [Rhizorhapis suberifaciens]
MPPTGVNRTPYPRIKPVLIGPPSPTVELVLIGPIWSVNQTPETVLIGPVPTRDFGVNRTPLTYRIPITLYL